MKKMLVFKRIYYTGVFYEISRLIICSIGVLAAGLIVDQSMKKWGALSENVSQSWILCGFLSLFFAVELIKSDFFKPLSQSFPQSTHHFSGLIKLVFAVLAIAILIVLPFIWFGVIEELAGGFTKK